ncbi:MAG TPA: GIY-YIG nuclease family protein [Stellaceae bacterium]
MKGAERKAAIAAYKEKKTVAGIFAVRCAASGQIWVGKAPDLSTMQNRIWFTLRQGNHPDAGLQRAWNGHGADNFAYEEVEALAEEETGYLREAALKSRLAHWQAALGAAII